MTLALPLKSTLIKKEIKEQEQNDNVQSQEHVNIVIITIVSVYSDSVEYWRIVFCFW